MTTSNDNNRLNTKNLETGFFLPDFCHARSVFMVVLVSELLALILALVHFQTELFWFELGQYSLVIQWISLLSTAVLCLFKKNLARLSDLQSGVISYLLVLTVTLVVTFSAIWVESWLIGRSRITLAEHPDLWSNLLVAAILSAVMLRFFYLQAQYRRRIVIAADAKLQALQARIHPHFLFNSMNIIAGLIPINPELAERVIEDLSDLFRASLSEHRSQVSLQSEIDLCQRYLGIEQLRLGDRLKTKWLLSEGMESVVIPPLTLQPLIENAIYHGIQPLVQGGLIEISVKIDHQRCNIVIENPLSDDTSDKNHGNQIALTNVRERLQMLYQDEASLVLDFEPKKCIVTLSLPCEKVIDENINR